MCIYHNYVFFLVVWFKCSGTRALLPYIGPFLMTIELLFEYDIWPLNKTFDLYSGILTIESDLCTLYFGLWTFTKDCSFALFSHSHPSSLPLCLYFVAPLACMEPLLLWAYLLSNLTDSMTFLIDSHNSIFINTDFNLYMIINIFRIYF